MAATRCLMSGPQLALSCVKNPFEMLMYGCVHSASKRIFALSSTQLRPAHQTSLITKWILLFLLMCISGIHAAVLPEDRADALFHSYDGGGAEISGPSLLVRKKFSEKLSATVNYYVDNVSSASIDVITTASPYTEKREENSVSFDYLNEKTLMSMGYTQSDESDFAASTVSLNISQDMFGDLTTINMGYAQGNNIVRRNGDDNFSEDVIARSYRLSASQVMTKDLILSFALETITDEGFLNNPYRSVRYIDSSSEKGYSFQFEIYPNTRTSNALAVRARYYLPQRAALHGGYRYFGDSWGIQANTVEVGYTLPYKKDWILEFSFRLYDQTGAEFYSDLFPYVDAQNFLARDKELSSFSTQTLGIGASYEFKKNGVGIIKRGSLNLEYNFIMFDYSDFRDISVNALAGEEPLYEQDANVIRLFASIWF